MVHRCRLIAAAALLASLLGCAVQAPAFRAGVPMQAPAGWVEYCQATPTDPSCPPTEAKP